MYGDQWQESIMCFTMLSLAILPQFVGSLTGAIYQSLGKTKLLFINSKINTAITVSGILFGVLIGGNIVSLATCVSFSYILHFFTTNYMLIHIGCEKKLLGFLKKIIPNLIMVVVSYAASIVSPIKVSNIFFAIIVKGAYLGIIYLIMLLLTKEYKVLLSFLRKKKN